MDAAEKFIDALVNAGRVVKPNGQDRWIAQCPAHDDGNPSLSVARGRGQVLMFCFAGCQVQDIALAVGWSMDSLFDDPKGVTYEYKSAGRTVRRVHRSPSKQFRQEVLEQGDGALYVPDGLDLEAAMSAGLPVFIPEGEKDVDALFKLGDVVAVTSAGGAQAWRKADWSRLSVASSIIVVADPDEPGMVRARELVHHLRTITAGEVVAVRAAVGKDAADHVTAGVPVDRMKPVDVDTNPEFEQAVEDELNRRQIRKEANDRERAADAAKVSDKLQPKTLGEILDMQHEDDWAIPGLLERGDRLVVTGVEGGGKSYFLRQISVMSAAGIDPFSRAPIKPMKVLVVDAENSERQWSRAAKYVTDLAEQWGVRSPRTEVVVAAGVRIDLGVTADANQIHKLIDEHKPDILQIGPLYKLVAKEIKTDDDAAPLIMTLDSFRERGLVLLMEAHTGLDGKGAKTLRPRGSSALLGWPEFGFGLLPTEENPEFVDLVRWRGDREQRAWPSGFRRGFKGELPWVPLRGGMDEFEEG